MKYLVMLCLVACGSHPRPPGVDAPAMPALGARIDRAGRPLTANALLGLLVPDAVGEQLKDDYNRAPRGEWPRFAAPLAEGLALYDGLDGICGNQWLAAPESAAGRYGRLAALLADDRLWVDSRAASCTRLFAVELGIAGDCGGRMPALDAVDVFRSRLVAGADGGIDDGVDRDDHAPTAAFPFLVAP